MKGLNLIYCSLFLLLLLASCKQQEQLWENEENQAKVSLVLSLPADKETRGNVSTYPKDPSKWTDEEKLADGRYFEYITVMILKNNVLEAYEDLDVTDKTAQTVIEFDKTFTTGTYTLMAVANYTELDDFKALLDGFKNGTKTYTELMAYKLKAGDDGIAPKTMQPLTLIKEISLHPGLNEISGEMLRTYSRIRIEVRNQSDVKDLVVSGISFSNNFAQKEAYIWPEQGYVSGSRVAIDASSNDAMTPFNQSITIPKMTSSGASTTVNSAVVFDAYILESEETDDNKKYTYTLDLSYGEGQSSGSGGQVTVPTGPIKDVTSIRNNYNNTFLIQNVKTSFFVRDYYSYVYQVNYTYDQLQAFIASGSYKEFLWVLEPYGTQDFYRIKNVGTGNYIGRVFGYVLVKPSSTAGDNYFKFYNYTSSTSDSNSQGIQMQYQGIEGSTCLNEYNSSYFWGGSLNTADGATAFVFYCIGDSNSDPNSNANTNTSPNSQEIPINLRTINKETARPEDVRRIKRNDFINALVTISYNETFGQFEFEVEDWNQAGGDITFN